MADYISEAHHPVESYEFLLWDETILGLLRCKKHFEELHTDAAMGGHSYEIYFLNTNNHS